MVDDAFVGNTGVVTGGVGTTEGIPFETVEETLETVAVVGPMVVCVLEVS